LTPPVLRLDKWLWFARFFKSRTLAAKLCQSRRIRINRTVIGKSKTLISEGDVLTFPKGAYVRIIKILKLGKRRGPALEAKTLYEDLEPPLARKEIEDIEKKDIRTAPVAERERGSGRPTKTERRATDKLHNELEQTETHE
jgi:ribosome-associated heat shock protein Hsp15